MPRRILGRVLPKETKVGRVYLPENRLVGAGQIGFEPIKIRVEQVGSEVTDIKKGDVLVLDSLELDYISKDQVIIPNTHHGKWYHPQTLRQYRSREEIARAKETEVMKGIILYAEAA